jgi:hypothetical protein
MKNGHDGQQQSSNVVSLAGARKQSTKDAKRGSKSRNSGERRPTASQWLTSVVFVALAIGGVFALTVPLLRAAGILGD